jgi:hypothetical protein
MMIKVSEVIEACAQIAEGWDSGGPIAKDIRAFAAKYDGCIVAEGEPSAVYKGRDYEYRVPLVDLPRGDVEYMTPLYRAREAT